MADFGGGIPGQVTSELKGIVKDTAKAVIGAGADIAKGTAEVLTGTTSAAPQSGGQVMPGEPDRETVLKQQREAAVRRRLGELRAELQVFYGQKKKQEEQEEQVAEEQKKMEEVGIKESKKKQEEKQVLGRLSRQYGGTGEVGKSGY